jgi:hypothetical protein
MTAATAGLKNPSGACIANVEIIAPGLRWERARPSQPE